MVERLLKSAGAGWRVLALGAAVSTACAALVVYRWQRSRSHELHDPYEAWWQRRDEVRKNGDRSSHLFV